MPLAADQRAAMRAGVEQGVEFPVLAAVKQDWSSCNSAG